MTANPERGEADLMVGGVPLVIAVTFEGLARLSRMTRADSFDEICRRLLGFEPWMASCALRVFCVHPESAEKAEAQALKAIAKMSAADELAFREAIEFALTAHLNEGRKARGEDPIEEQVRKAAEDADAMPGERPGPAA